MVDPQHAEGVWEQFALIHQHSDRRVLDHRAWAVDETLDCLLAQIGDVSQRRLKNLLTNRAKKYRRRRRILLQRFAHEVTLSDETFPGHRLMLSERVGWVRSRTTRLEWRILQDLASTADYATVAVKLALPVGTVKSIVSRCRARLRREAECD